MVLPAACWKRSITLVPGRAAPGRDRARLGLVNRVYDDAALAGEARKLAHELAAVPTVALGPTRRLYWESTENSHEEQLDLEVRLRRIAGASADAKEGVQAFLQKRPAKFSRV